MNKIENDHNVVFQLVFYDSNITDNNAEFRLLQEKC
jgi:hypothetical protein